MKKEIYPKERPLGSHTHLGSLIELLFIYKKRERIMLQGITETCYKIQYTSMFYYTVHGCIKVS